MPFTDDAVRIDHTCGKGADGHWLGWFRVMVAGDELRRLGLHPDQLGPAFHDPPEPPPRWYAG